MRFREGVMGTWWSPMPGGEESDRGAGGGSGGEASGGASQSRSSHSGTDRSSVGRGRAVAGVGGRGLVAGASAAGMEQSPVRPASVGGRLGTPSRSRGAAVAAGGSAVSPADMRTVPRPAARAPVSVSLILALVGRPRQSPPAPPRGSAASVAAGAAAPPTGALMAPPRAPGLHESRRRTERGSLAAALYWKTTLWYNLNCTVGGGRICTPPES